jgi:hypothetical protein
MVLTVYLVLSLHTEVEAGMETDPTDMLQSLEHLGQVAAAVLKPQAVQEQLVKVTTVELVAQVMVQGVAEVVQARLASMVARANQVMVEMVVLGCHTV